MTRSEKVYKRIKGPVVPLQICFNEDESIDFKTLHRYVNWLCENKVPIIMLTYGSSEFASLTESEIFQITEEVARANAGRALFIASTGYWPLHKCREFLKHADSVGADAVKVEIHTQHGASRDVIVNYFDNIQNSSTIPLLLWVVLSDFSVDTIVELAKRAQIIGMKNDGDQFYVYYNAIRATINEEFAVISGGQMKNFVFGFQNGSPAYLCPIAPFRPDIAIEFYKNLLLRNYESAWEYVHKYEDPWIKVAVELGWLQSIKTALKNYGLFPNNKLRLPCKSHTDDEYNKICDSLNRIFKTGGMSFEQRYTIEEQNL